MNRTTRTQGAVASVESEWASIVAILRTPRWAAFVARFQMTGTRVWARCRWAGAAGVDPLPPNRLEAEGEAEPRTDAQALGLTAQPGHSGRTSQMLWVDADTAWAAGVVIGTNAAVPRVRAARMRAALMRASFMR